MGITMQYTVQSSSPYIDRFLQPDTLIPNAANPQSWNRYSYTLNNPIRFSDPTGHMVADDDDGGVGPTPPIPPADPPHGGGGHGGNDSSPLDDLILEAVDAFYHNPILGGSSSGCNTWILHNTDNSWCHHNTYASQPICPIFQCSDTQAWNYASSFQYPGQLPWMPLDIPLGSDKSVDRSVVGGDLFPGTKFASLGAIYVTRNGSTLINSTKDTYIFANGQINRTISGGEARTEGFGTNSNGFIAFANQYGGPLAFQANDFAMGTFSIVDHLSGGMLMQLIDSMPPKP